MAPVVNQLWLKNTFDRLNISLHTVKNTYRSSLKITLYYEVRKKELEELFHFFLNSTDYDFCNLVIFQTE